MSRLYARCDCIAAEDADGLNNFQQSGRAYSPLQRHQLAEQVNAVDESTLVLRPCIDAVKCDVTIEFKLYFYGRNRTIYSGIHGYGCHCRSCTLILDTV